MSDETKTLPPATLTALVPPNKDFDYFKNFDKHRFQPMAAEFSLVNAWWLAELSLLAYGDVDWARGRLAASRVEGDLDVISGEKFGSQCFLLDTEEFLAVAFRGTRVDGFPDPITSLKLRLVNQVDLKTDVDFALPPGVDIHPGFARSLDEIWEVVHERIEASMAQSSGKTLWFTGHSLGAALATIAAFKLGPETTRGLYTFGSPRVGNASFDKKFKVACNRFVDQADVVPHLPPRDFLADYRHVGDLRFIGSDGSISGQTSAFEEIETGVRSNIQSFLEGLRTLDPARLLDAGRIIFDAVRRQELSRLDERLTQLNLDFIPIAGLTDHAPINYAIRVWNVLVRSTP